MPVSKTVPLGDGTGPKQFAVTHVSVVVGKPSGPVGWTVMFMRPVVVTTPASATWIARLTGSTSVWVGITRPPMVSPESVRCSTSVESSPQPGNGSLNGQLPLMNSVIVHVIDAGCLQPGCDHRR